MNRLITTLYLCLPLVPLMVQVELGFKQHRPLEATLHKMAITQKHLWAIDYGQGGIYKSDDAGETWQKSAGLKAEFFESIQFIDDLTGFVCGDYGYVYRTTDGGHTWQNISPEIDGRITEHYRNDSTKNQKPKGQFLAYYDMYFKNAQSGYVSGFSTQPSSDRPTFEPIAFFTEDGGNSWHKTPYNELKPSEFLNEAPAFVAGAFHLNKQQIWKTRRIEKEWVVQFSKDGGETWQQSQLPGFKEDNQWVLRKVLFKDKDHGFVIGGTLDDKDSKALIFFTNDGGKNWNPYPNNWPHLHDAIFMRDKIFLSGKNGFLKSIAIDSIQNSNTFRDPRDRTEYPILTIGEANWFGKNLEYNSDEFKSFAQTNPGFEDAGRLYDWSDSSQLCPEGWRIPTITDAYELIGSLNGTPNSRRGKRVHYSELAHLNIKMGGLHSPQPETDRIVAAGNMEVWLTSSDTTWNNPDPEFQKYNGHKVIGIHFYKVAGDSIMIEPTFVNSGSGRMAFCRCIKNQIP